MAQQRTPSGVPTGGQWLASAHDESDIALEDTGPPAKVESRIEQNYRLAREAHDRVDELIHLYETDRTADHEMLLSELVGAAKAAKRRSLINKQMGNVPHGDAYKQAAIDSIQDSGLGPLSDPNRIWTDTSKHTNNNLGFHTHGKFTDIEAERQTNFVQGQIQALRDNDPDRELHVGAYAAHRFPLTTAQAQFVSVSLTADEQRQVTSRLASDMPDVNWDQSVTAWSSGVPECELGTDYPTQYASRHWDAVSETVRQECPRAQAALMVANTLRDDAGGAFVDRNDYLSSDQWNEDQVDAELDGN